MRCKNPDCLRTMRSPSDKTKETGLCGECRKKINKAKEIQEKNVIVVKPKGRTKYKKSKLNAYEKFEESLKSNPEYHKFINMFRGVGKINVKTV